MGEDDATASSSAANIVMESSEDRRCGISGGPTMEWDGLRVASSLGPDFNATKYGFHNSSWEYTVGVWSIFPMFALVLLWFGMLSAFIPWVVVKREITSIERDIFGEPETSWSGRMQ
jgi:hypothetical protein